MSDENLDAGTGTGIELAANNYPFVLPSSDLRGILADFWFSYDNPAFEAPFSISELHHFSRVLGTEPQGGEDEHQCDVIIVDANDDIVCDTRDGDYAGREFGDRFYVHEWRLPTMVVRAVQHREIRDGWQPEGETLRGVFAHYSEGYSEGISETFSESEWSVEDYRRTEEDELRRVEQGAPTLPTIIYVENGQLDARTYDLMPTRVKTVRVGDEVVSGDIVLHAGYNIQFDTQTSKINNPNLSVNIPGSISLASALDNILTISVLDGAGDGPVGACVGQVDGGGIRSINQVKPDDRGNFRLSAKDCLYVSQPTYTNDPTGVVHNALQVGNHCERCCSCQDYVDVYDRITNVHNKLKTLIRLTEETRDSYHDVLDEAQLTVECSKNRPIGISMIGGVVETETSWSTTATVAVSVANVSDVCYNNIVTTLNFTLPGAPYPPVIYSPLAMSVDDNGIASRATISGTWPNYQVTWPKISPGRSVRVQFTLAWSGLKSAVPVLTGYLNLCTTTTTAAGTIPLNGTPFVPCSSIGLTT